jgi:hypothetical protein
MINDITNADTIGGWITLTRYCEYSGETRQSVHTRVALGKWKRGVHYSAPDGGSAWVNVPAVVDWIKSSLQDTDVEKVQEAEDFALKVAPTLELPKPVAPLVEPPKMFTTYLAERVQAEGLPAMYINSTGMDLAVDGKLPVYTGVEKSARQFFTLEDCQKFCDSEVEFHIPTMVELPYV